LENHHLCGGSAPHDKVVAPFVVDGPITRAAFLAYLEQCLGQHSSAAIDNLPAHKGVAVEKAIKTAARLLYLPKYSPSTVEIYPACPVS
jgi:transposase